MITVHCQTCGDRTRTDGRGVANDVLIAHLRRGHRVVRKPVDAPASDGSSDE